MLYLLFLLAHLFAALIFIGTVFFEVLILGRLHRQLPARVMLLVEQGIGQRARALMPWVLLMLFGAGVGMVWLRYLPVLAAPFASSFGTLLTLKLILAASAPEAYRRSLAQEIHLVSCHLGSRQPVDYFQWRGPAPVGDVQALMAPLFDRLHFLEHDRGDYGIDLDPRHTDWASVGVLRELGFNRVCIGVPDAPAEDDYSQAYYRDPAPIESLIDAARTFDFRSVSVDLGYGSAWQTLASFEAKLASLIALEPDRLQVFGYATPPSRYPAQPAQAQCRAADKTAMRQLCFARLDAAGYHYIGLGQFARGDDDLTQAQERGRLSRTAGAVLVRAASGAHAGG